MGVFFRPLLISIIIGLGFGLPVVAQDQPADSSADFEAVEQDDWFPDPAMENAPMPAPPEGEPAGDDLEDLEPAPSPETDPAVESSEPTEEPIPEEGMEGAAQPTSTKKKEDWVSPYHSISWPGSFMAVRLGFGAGNALVPGFGAGNGIRARTPISQIAPYAGIELGTTSRRWGGSFSVDGTLLGMQPEFLAAPPTHVVVSLNAYHAPKDSLFRWEIGLRPFIHYGLESPDGEFFHLRGYGFQLGAHRLLSKGRASALEGYVTLSVDRYTEAVAGDDDDDRTVPMGDLIGVRSLSALFMIQAGVQFSLLR